MEAMEPNFGEKLKVLRETHFPGEGLRQVGKQLEMQGFGEHFYSQLSKMENGVILPSINFLPRIAKAYRLSDKEMNELVSIYTMQKIQGANLVPEHHEFAAETLFRKVKKNKTK